MKSQQSLALLILIVVAVLAVVLLRKDRAPVAEVGRDIVKVEPAEASVTPEMTLADVLDDAAAALEHMEDNLIDYKARFVKQERGVAGALGPLTEIDAKIQSRCRSANSDAPLRVYLKYRSPEPLAGREVIWAEDLYDGKMCVHEAGIILGLKRIWLDPTGMIAMSGERYPISDIGLVRLIEKLIERGEPDRDNPDVRVTSTKGHLVGDVETELIEVRRKSPDGSDFDYSMAEVAIDRDRQLVLSYRSYGWPSEPGEPAPLLESYTFYDLELNVGLTDEDFDPSNPEYSFPLF